MGQWGRGTVGPWDRGTVGPTFESPGLISAPTFGIRHSAIGNPFLISRPQITDNRTGPVTMSR